MQGHNRTLEPKPLEFTLFSSRFKRLYIFCDNFVTNGHLPKFHAFICFSSCIRQKVKRKPQQSNLQNVVDKDVFTCVYK